MWKMLCKNENLLLPQVTKESVFFFCYTNFFLHLCVSLLFFTHSLLPPVPCFPCLVISVIFVESNLFLFCFPFPFLPKLLTFFFYHKLFTIYAWSFYIYILYLLNIALFLVFFFFFNKSRVVARKMIALSLCLYWKCVCFVW